MTTPENHSPKSIHGIPVPPSMAEEIEQVLEIMRRVRIAQAAQTKHEVEELPGNTYELPEPLIYPAGGSTDGE